MITRLQAAGKRYSTLLKDPKSSDAEVEKAKAAFMAIRALGPPSACARRNQEEDEEAEMLRTQSREEKDADTLYKEQLADLGAR